MKCNRGIRVNERQGRFSRCCSFKSLFFFILWPKSLNVNFSEQVPEPFECSHFRLFLFICGLTWPCAQSQQSWQRFLFPPSNLDTLFHHDGLVSATEKPGLRDGFYQLVLLFVCVCVVFSTSSHLFAWNSVALVSLVSNTRTSASLRRGSFTVWAVVFCVWGA